MCLEIHYIYKNCGCVARTGQWTCGTQKSFDPPKPFSKECPRFASTTQTQRLGDKTCAKHVGKVLRVVTPELEVYEGDFDGSGVGEDSDNGSDKENGKEGKEGKKEVLAVGDKNGDGEAVEGDDGEDTFVDDSESDGSSGEELEVEEEGKEKEKGAEQREYEDDLAAQVKGLTVNGRTLGGGSGEPVKKGGTVEEDLPGLSVKGLMVNGKVLGSGMGLRRMDGGIGLGKKDAENGGASASVTGLGWGVDKELPTLRHMVTRLGKKDAEKAGSSGVDKDLPAIPPKDKRRTPSPEKK